MNYWINLFVLFLIIYNLSILKGQDRINTSTCHEIETSDWFGRIDYDNCNFVKKEVSVSWFDSISYVSYTKDYVNIYKYGHQFLVRISNLDSLKVIVNTGESECYDDLNNIIQKSYYLNGVSIQEILYDENRSVSSFETLDTLNKIKTKKIYKNEVLYSKIISTGYGDDRESIIERLPNLKISKHVIDSSIYLQDVDSIVFSIRLENTGYSSSLVIFKVSNNISFLSRNYSSQQLDVGEYKDYEFVVSHNKESICNRGFVKILSNQSEVIIPVNLTGRHIDWEINNSTLEIIQGENILIENLNTTTSVTIFNDIITPYSSTSYDGFIIASDDIPKGRVFGLLTI
jgi:hypothetical protein